MDMEPIALLKRGGRVAEWIAYLLDPQLRLLLIYLS